MSVWCQGLREWWSLGSGTGDALGSVASGGTSLCAVGVLDVVGAVSGVRGLWSVGNWCYQCVYFAVRMWLVFVLHAFCVAAFCVLWSLWSLGLPLCVV